jgi:hypothetical protein
MARFADVVGFAVQAETKPGYFDDVITEKQYFGDVRRAARQALTGDKLNDDFTLENTVEIVADTFANENILAIRYVKWAGVLWKVSNVEIQAPRLLLRLGGVYNGPVPSVP